MGGIRNLKSKKGRQCNGQQNVLRKGKKFLLHMRHPPYVLLLFKTFLKI